MVMSELSRKRAEAGRAGGYATFFTYGREKMVEWAKEGGRPRSKTLEELMVTNSSCELEERRALPAVTSGLKLSNVLQGLLTDKKEKGGGRPMRLSSPEGVNR